MHEIVVHGVYGLKPIDKSDVTPRGHVVDYWGN